VYEYDVSRKGERGFDNSALRGRGGGEDGGRWRVHIIANREVMAVNKLKKYGRRNAILYSKDPCGIPTLETYYSNFIASQLYMRKGACSVLRLVSIGMRYMTSVQKINY